jgi:hypothetical protein
MQLIGVALYGLALVIGAIGIDPGTAYGYMVMLPGVVLALVLIAVKA